MGGRREPGLSWFLSSALDSGWEIIQSGRGSPLANHGINLPTFVELGLELFQYPLIMWAQECQKMAFLFSLRLCLVMEIKKQSEYFHVVLVFGGKLGNLFLPFF